MNLLVVGDPADLGELLKPLRDAGVAIEYTCWNGAPPVPSPKSGIYDGLFCSGGILPQAVEQLRILMSRNDKAPLWRMDSELKQPSSDQQAVLVGAIERKRDGEKILNCTLAEKVSPHPEKSDPFGQIVYEYHAPCGP